MIRLMEKNNQVKNAQIGLLIGIVIQVILCFQNLNIFGWFALAMGAYLIFGLFKLKKDKQYWIRMQRIVTIIVIIEVLVSLPLLYIFQNIIK